SLAVATASVVWRPPIRPIFSSSFTTAPKCSWIAATLGENSDARCWNILPRKTTDTDTQHPTSHQLVNPGFCSPQTRLVCFWHKADVAAEPIQLGDDPRPLDLPSRLDGAASLGRRSSRSQRTRSLLSETRGLADAVAA